MSMLEDMAAEKASERYPDVGTPENGYLGNIPELDTFIGGAMWLAELDPPSEVLDAMFATLRGDTPDEDEGRDLYEDEKPIMDDWQHHRITDEEMWLRMHRVRMRRMWKAGMEALLRDAPQAEPLRLTEREPKKEKQ